MIDGIDLKDVKFKVVKDPKQLRQMMNTLLTNKKKKQSKG